MTVFSLPSHVRKLLAVVAGAATTACLVTAVTPPVAVAAAPAAATTGVTVGSQSHAVDGTNVARATDALVLYTPVQGVSTRTNEWGVEVAVVNGTVATMADHVGNMSIPAGGYVLSGHGTSGSWLRQNAAVGTSVTRTDTPAPPGGSFRAVLNATPGLTHYYPLTATHQARDVVGNVDGSVRGTGVTFSGDGATFTGHGYVELPDHDDFSVATEGGFTVLVDLTINDWRGAAASQYVHWMGKGVPGGHEWTFRHYVRGASGEAAERQGRVSFYHFNPPGGLGAGSYIQDAMDGNRHFLSATANLKQVQLFKNGQLRDTDALSGYDITPRNTSTPVRIGTRGDNTGFLVGTVRRVAFFDRVLSPSEIQRLATATRR